MVYTYTLYIFSGSDTVSMAAFVFSWWIIWLSMGVHDSDEGWTTLEDL